MFGRVFGYIRFMLSSRKKIYSLRKRYDRTREKADRVRGAEKRLGALRVLDQVEPTLVLLEEQKISRRERHRMFQYVNSGIRQSRAVMKGRFRPGSYQNLPRRK